MTREGLDDRPVVYTQYRQIQELFLHTSAGIQSEKYPKR